MNIKNYLEYINTPWGELFYKLVWNHLQFHDLKILDFGSGFGITAEHLSKNNSVIAIEPNEDMVKMSMNDGSYTQFLGSIEKLKDFEDSSFVICRFSGTEPLLRIFAESSTKEKAAEYVIAWKNFLNI